jgi:zinc protease
MQRHTSLAARALTGAGMLALVCTNAVPALAQQRAARAAAAAPAAKLATVVTVEGITEYSLPNGLRVLLFPDPSKPTTTVNITYFVGSRHEGYGETGMAHLFEHILFKGSKKHPNIPQELTEHGSSPNGTTWFDRTNFFETFPATNQHLDWALDLEADRMVNSFVKKSDLDTEMTVVRNEYELGENDPGSVLLDRTMATAYLWHNYGKTTIGARSDIENVPIERLRAWYDKYYKPDNAMLVIAGKFDEATAKRLVEEKFGSIPRPSRTGINKIYETYTAEPTQDGERSVTLRRVGDVQVVDAVYHVPAGSHQDFAAIEILSQVLGSEPSGRLYKALVQAKKAARIAAFDFQLKEPGALVLTAEVRKEDSLDSAAVVMRRTVDDLLANPATAEEVDRARGNIIKNIGLMLNSSDRVGLQLSEWASMGDWRLLFINRDRIKKVTPADVQRVATAYLKPSNLTLGMFIPTPKPDRSEIPAAPPIASIVAGYKGDTALAVGEAFDPSPGNIESRTQRSTLPSGFKLALLPKKTRGGTVSAQINLRFGSEATLSNLGAAPQLAASMLMRGTRSHTRQQIKDEFDRLKARVNVGQPGPPGVINASVETIRENLPAALKLLGEVLKDPAFDAREFTELKQEHLSDIEQQKSEPTMVAFTAFSRALSPWPKGHPRYTGTIDEQIADLNAAQLEQARKFYTDLYGASNGELAIVGDFDAAEVTKIATDIFGNWKSPQPYQRVAAPYKDVPTNNISLETPDKANAFFLSGINMNLRDDDPGYPALVLGNYMLGGGFLNSRLATRIRQKEGISYGVGSFLNASSWDKNAQFIANAIYAPENVGRLETAYREEMDRALKEGFTAEEVQKAKEGYLQSRQVARAQDASLARSLANYLYIGRTLQFDAAFEQQVSKLDPQAIVTVLRTYIDPTKFVTVKAGDFAKKKPTS